MEKIFLDANYLIDLVERRSEFIDADLDSHELYVSPLSLHILFYLYKYKMPPGSLMHALNTLSIIDFDNDIAEKAMLGPTPDFEDNVQLHSAIAADCALFLTNDKVLIKMGYFGNTKIVANL